MVVETAYVIFPIALLIIVLNGFLLAGLKNKFRRDFTTYDFFLISFTFSNFIQGIVTYPFLIYTLASGENTDHWQCITSALLMLNCSISGIWHLIVLSVERLLSLKYPLKYQQFQTSWAWRGIGIGIPWICGCFWSIAPLLGWNSYVVEFPGRPNCNIDLRDRTSSGSSYLVLLFVFNYVIPISACSYAFYNLRKELKNLSKMAAETVGSESTITKRTLKTERRQTILIFAMMTSFIGVWTPYAVIVLYKTIGNKDVGITLYESASILAKLSCILNPIVYGLVYKDIRYHVRQAFRGKNKVEDISGKSTVSSH